MKKLLTAAALALSMGTAAADAADDLTLQLKWVTQAQFAGIDWMPSALAAREKGLPLVNIAQPFKRSGMMLTCRADSGIKTPEDFPGHTLGVWFFGNEYPFLAWMSILGIPTDGSPGGVTVLKQGFNVDPILNGQADCVSTMTYNEYWQIIDAGLKPEDLVTFKYEDQGVATLEDGLYVLEDRLKDPKFEDELVRFVRASMKGWKWAEENPDEAAMIVLEYDETGAQTEHHQKRMMGEIAKLTAGSNGALDPADYERTVALHLIGCAAPGAPGHLSPRRSDADRSLNRIKHHRSFFGNVHVAHPDHLIAPVKQADPECI